MVSGSLLLLLLTRLFDLFAFCYSCLLLSFGPIR
jgi:hypothetical protein